MYDLLIFLQQQFSINEWLYHFLGPSALSIVFWLMFIFMNLIVAKLLWNQVPDITWSNWW